MLVMTVAAVNFQLHIKLSNILFFCRAVPSSTERDRRDGAATSPPPSLGVKAI